MNKQAISKEYKEFQQICSKTEKLRSNLADNKDMTLCQYPGHKYWGALG